MVSDGTTATSAMATTCRAHDDPTGSEACDADVGPAGEHSPADAAAANETPWPSGRSEVKVPLMVRARISLVRAFLLLYARCFGMSGLYLLGRFFGTLEYLTDYNRRRRVHRKLIDLFDGDYTPAERRRIAQRYFMRIRCDKMFYTIMDRIPRNKLLNRIKFKGGRNIDEALTKGNGCYAALCHFGSHHVAGLMMALMGYKIAGVRDPKESHVRRYIQNKYQETFPEVAAMRMVHASSFPRILYRHLRGNGILASLLDVDRRRGDHTKTHPVTFFGREREWLIGPLQMALRCGSPIVQGFVVSRRNFYYRLIATPPLIDTQALGRDEPAVIAEVLHRYAQGVERFARAHPDHLMNI